MEYCSAIKKEWNSAFCSNTNGPRGYYAKWDTSDRERQTLYGFTYMWNLKNKTNEQTIVYPYNGILLSNKKEQTIDTQNNLDEFPGNYGE